MDINNLIAQVYARPPLWDKRNKLRGDRNLIDKYWRQISIEMKDSETKLRKKWKYLRDQFSVELGRFPPGDETYQPKWIHFNSLLFLKEMVKPRGLIQKPKNDNRRRRLHHVVEKNGTSSASEDDLPDNDLAGDSQSDQDMSLLELLEHENSQKRNSYVDDNVHQPVKRIKKSGIGITEDEDDEDLCFFKSLLPHVRKIPENKILSFRSRIQETVEEFAYRSELVDVKLF